MTHIKSNLIVVLIILASMHTFNASAEGAAAQPAVKTEAAPAASPVPVKEAVVEASPTPSPAPTPTATPVAEVTPKVEVPKEAVAADSEEKQKKHKTFSAGPFITLVTLPRPFSFGAESKWIDLLGLSASYGFLPQITLSSVSLKISGYDVRFKIYPFRGSFFLGVGYGKQSFTGSSTQDISAVSTTVNVTQDNTFIAPQMGWNWVWNSGLFMGVDLGVQLSMSHTTTVTDNVNALIQLTPQYAQMRSDIIKNADLIGKTPLPLLTLIKIGYLF